MIFFSSAGGGELVVAAVAVQRAPSSWESYTRVLQAWLESLTEHGVGLFDERRRLKDALSAYAVHRACGAVDARFETSTWVRHVNVLAVFYR